MIIRSLINFQFNENIQLILNSLPTYSVKNEEMLSFFRIVKFVEFGEEFFQEWRRLFYKHTQHHQWEILIVLKSDIEQVIDILI